MTGFHRAIARGYMMTECKTTLSVNGGHWGVSSPLLQRSDSITQVWQKANASTRRPIGQALGSGLQFHIPVKIIHPALMQKVGRKLAAIIVQIVHGWVIWLLCREHARILRHFPAFFQVTG